MHSLFSNLPPNDPSMILAYQKVGRAFAEWAKLEATLSEWFQHSAGISQHATAYRIFFCVTGSSMRLQLVEASLKATELDTEWAAFLKTAINTVYSEIPFRNSLAHGLFSGYKGENVVHVASQRSALFSTESYKDLESIDRWNEYIFSLNEVLWISLDALNKHDHTTCSEWHERLRKAVNSKP